MCGRFHASTARFVDLRFSRWMNEPLLQGGGGAKLRGVTETAEQALEIRPETGRRTIARLWRDAVEARRTGPAYLVESENGWSEVSWADADERVRAYANGFLARGVRKGDNVALLARNTLNWAIVDFALAQIGAVGIPVYASSSSRDVGYLLAHSEAVAIVCEDADQLAKVEAVTDELPALQHVITSPRPRRARRARARPRRVQPERARRRDGCRRRGRPLHDHLHVGDDRAAQGLHAPNRNYYEMASVVDRIPELLPGGRPDVLYLPLAHNYGRPTPLLGAKVGFTIAFLSDPAPRRRGAAAGAADAASERAQGVREGVFRGPVPVRRGDGGRRRLIDWALGVGREVSGLEAQGAPVPAGLRAKRGIADRLVFTKVREALGGDCGCPARAERRSRRRSPSSSMPSWCGSRRARPHRVHDRVQRERP